MRSASYKCTDQYTTNIKFDERIIKVTVLNQPGFFSTSFVKKNMPKSSTRYQVVCVHAKKIKKEKKKKSRKDTEKEKKMESRGRVKRKGTRKRTPNEKKGQPMGKNNKRRTKQTNKQTTTRHFTHKV